MTDLILIADDEPRRILGFEIELKLTFPALEVVVKSRVHGIEETLHAEHARIRCLVLDIMMAHGSRYSAAETSGGTRTGVLIHRDLRAFEASQGLSPLPVVVLTNVRGNLETLARDPMCRLLYKPETPPSALAEAVHGAMNQESGP